MKPLTLKQDLQITIFSLILLIIGFCLGQSTKQSEIENRAKKIEKECYTKTDIELITFGEPQL